MPGHGLDTEGLLCYHHPLHPCSAAADIPLRLSVIIACRGKIPCNWNVSPNLQYLFVLCQQRLSKLRQWPADHSLACQHTGSLLCNYLRFQDASCRKAVWPTQRQRAPSVGCNAPRRAQAAADPALAHHARCAARSRDCGSPHPQQCQWLRCHQCPHRRCGVQSRV